MNKVDIQCHNYTIKKNDRIHMYKQKPFLLWFTGLSGSGKSTLANELEKYFFKENYKTYLLDGDNVRKGLNSDLGFDEKSRAENIRRIGEVAKLFLDSGMIVLAAFLSLFEKDRKIVRTLVEEDEFIEIFVDVSLEICEKRDPKGLYKKARNGELKDFTGIHSAYEVPKSPEIHLDNTKNIDENIDEIILYLQKKGYIRGNNDF